MTMEFQTLADRARLAESCGMREEALILVKAAHKSFVAALMDIDWQTRLQLMQAQTETTLLRWEDRLTEELFEEQRRSDRHA
jgi:hypothetical protein